jgi:hypothetical protein
VVTFSIDMNGVCKTGKRLWVRRGGTNEVVKSYLSGSREAFDRALIPQTDRD